MASGYLGRVIDALLNRAAAAPAGPDASPAELRARVAALEMDVADRDKRIAAMQAEYEAASTGGRRDADTAAQRALEDLAKRLVGILSNAAVLDAMARDGKEVRAADALSLARDVEKQLVRAGLERIGAVGEVAPFDVSVHQRMSGGSAHPAGSVVVRMPGYRFGGRVLLKAMVDVRDDGQGAA